MCMVAFTSFVTGRLTWYPWSGRSTKVLTPFYFRRNRVTAADAVCLVDSLSEAVQRGYVQPFGNRICLDPDGFFPSREAPVLPSEYVNVLGDAATKIRAVLAFRRVRAIFVRGSIVTGNLLGDLRSDLDLIVFTKLRVTSDEKRRLQDLLLPKLRNSLQVGGVDIRYVHKDKSPSERRQFRLSPTLKIILCHFATPVYGSREEVGISDVRVQPTPHLAIDIRNDMNSFQRAMETQDMQDCFSLQLSAIQWLSKKCLRAVAELAALKIGAYARDLLPCYQLASEAYPKFADIMLHGLLIACASPANRYLDMRKDDILHIGTSNALQFAEIVEELAIQQCFGSGLVPGKEFASIVSSDLLLTWKPSVSYELLKERILTTLFLFRRWIAMDTIALDKIKFWRRPLPVLELAGSRFIDVHVIDANIEKFSSGANFDNIVTNVPEPVVYRDRQQEGCNGGEITRQVLKCLLRSARTVQCRVAQGHNVTFCRSSHKWLEQRIFTAPSVLVSLPVSEAVQRLCENHRLPNVIYDNCNDECVYIQSKVIPSLQVFNNSGSQRWQIVQEERVWISSHGTVSTLHYDASYSALYQRCGQKRLLFFPPCCLPHLGCYPLGHPLHRRGRVDLTRKDTIIFKTVWKECVSKAIEATLLPGDLLLFPPFWSHYTETIASSPQELSISHTLRYVYQ